MVKKIIIDCGHGENTAGKFSPIKENGERFYEWKSNRHLGKLLGDKLKEHGIDFCYTVNPDDNNDMSLANRVGIANTIAYKEGKDNVLFLSIHSDALGMGDKWYDDATGYSIFTSTGNTMSDTYAKIIEGNAKQILSEHGKKVRGCYNKNFYVLSKTICPAILIENLFYTSKSDLNFLESEKGKSILIEILLKSILDIININN